MRKKPVTLNDKEPPHFCIDCHWWRSYGYIQEDGKKYGNCMFRPPILVIDNSQEPNEAITEWAVTESEDYCSEFKLRALLAKGE